ncbi:uncharacterized protein LOC141877829 isoform X4 [Acropora palmata]|uniref:uncharacterized protein LOC141877829 isoform X4 n=1 Tax=Acropora palmata TaxID=6131 RepID=UPI003DA007D4
MRGRIIRLDEPGQTFVVSLWLFVSGIKTGARRIVPLDELSSVVRLCASNESQDGQCFENHDSLKEEKKRKACKKQK